jgi:hypothetical protein
MPIVQMNFGGHLLVTEDSLINSNVSYKINNPKLINLRFSNLDIFFVDEFFQPRFKRAVAISL